MTIQRIYGDDYEDLLTPEQWKIAEEAARGNRHCMRGLSEIYESMWHRRCMSGDRYVNPDISPQQLFRLAFQWRVKAALAGDSESMRWLSVYMVQYKDDYHITEEMAGGFSALQWQEKAADAGDRYAMKWMGDIYSDSYYENFDQQEATLWYIKSAEAGCVYAMHELGERYLGGIGVKSCRTEATHWYKRSAEAIACWRDLSGTEIRMAMTDVAIAANLMMEGNVTSEDLEWIRAHSDLAMKLTEKLAVQPEIVKELRKVKMKFNRILQNKEGT